MKIALCLSFSLVVIPAAAQERSWHLLTQSQGGVVSLLKDLTKHECDFARNRALGLPATDEEREAQDRVYREANPRCPAEEARATEEAWVKWRAEHPMATGCTQHDGMGSMSWGGGRIVQSGDIKSAECFQ